ncbi:hypothetical protein ACOMHN_052661 [Nucella lapillus]
MSKHSHGGCLRSGPSPAVGVVPSPDLQPALHCPRVKGPGQETAGVGPTRTADCGLCQGWAQPGLLTVDCVRGGPKPGLLTVDCVSAGRLQQPTPATVCAISSPTVCAHTVFCGPDSYFEEKKNTLFLA